MERYRVRPDDSVNFDRHDPGDTGDYKTSDQGKVDAKAAAAKLIEQLTGLQERLYANQTRSLLIVLQGMDTSGKDGTISHVMTGLNPQGCTVVSFKVPSAEEQGHDFLWRVHQKAPSRGEIGIFNRSHYEDVLVTRVHGSVSDQLAKQRFNQIREFEDLLTENGTTVLKFFLHISKDEQKQRLEERVADPDKRWKFNESDLEERKRWDDYMKAFADVLAATSTEHAPWYIVPANRKWYRNLVVADRVAHALEEMALGVPPAPKGIDFAKLKIV